jgi:hypothetical protein
MSYVICHLALFDDACDLCVEGKHPCKHFASPGVSFRGALFVPEADRDVLTPTDGSEEISTALPGALVQCFVRRGLLRYESTMSGRDRPARFRQAPVIQTNSQLVQGNAGTGLD